MMLSELYSPLEVLHYVCPIAITLATDRVADVRTISFKLVSMLVLSPVQVALLQVYR